jgi:hypothetical protein
MPRIAKVTKLANARNLIAGVSRHFTKRGSYRVAGESHSTKELVALLRSHVAAIGEVDAARIRLSVAVRAERTLAKRVARINKLLKLRVENEFGFRADVWADFGWRLPKPPGPKTVAGKLAGARKRQAAREARKRRESSG